MAQFNIQPIMPHHKQYQHNGSTHKRRGNKFPLLSLGISPQLFIVLTYYLVSGAFGFIRFLEQFFQAMFAQSTMFTALFCSRFTACAGSSCVRGLSNGNQAQVGN